MFGEAILLGLSTGTFCVMYCAPVALPFLFSEEMDAKKNARYVILFMLGRLAGYLAVGAVLGLIGAYAVKYLDPQIQRRAGAAAFILIGLMMIASGVLYHFPGLRICSLIKKTYRPRGAALFYGLFTALNLCPPFFAAAARVFGGSSGVLQGASYFLFFFIGTSVFFLPLFAIFRIRKHMEKIRTVARLTLILLGIYFTLIQGIYSFLI